MAETKIALPHLVNATSVAVTKAESRRDGSTIKLHQLHPFVTMACGLQCITKRRVREE